MSKLTPASEALRIAQVLQVIALVQSGLALRDALEKANITSDVYYDWISKAHEAVDVFYNLIQESERRELTRILSMRERILQNMLDKVSSATASNLDIIAALVYMDKRQDQLESRQGVANQSEINAQDYLKGPKTSMKTSRMTATVVLEGEGSVTVTRTDHDVIDGEVREPAKKPGQALLPSALQDLDLEADPSQMSDLNPASEA